jgi:hypothetical protein
MIFYVKVGSLKCKARYIAGGHTTNAPAAMKYASVLSWKSVHLGLLIAGLKGLSILSADKKNLYLTSPCLEKTYTVLGQEFGPHRQGWKALVVLALYGRKSAGAAFRNHLARCLEHLGYKSLRGDPDLWFRAATNVTKERIMSTFYCLRLTYLPLEYTHNRY